MAATYTPIASITLGAAASSVTFSSIPQTYTDLVLVANASTPSGGIVCGYRFNGDTGTNYSQTRLGGNGTTVFSDRASSASFIGGTLLTSAASPTGVFTFHIMNYTNTTTYKTGLFRGSNPNGQMGMSVGLWRNTAAITSVSFGGEFTADVIADSTFTLYGILGANA